jgi:hypothetical protein
MGCKGLRSFQFGITIICSEFNWVHCPDYTLVRSVISLGR